MGLSYRLDRKNKDQNQIVPSLDLTEGDVDITAPIILDENTGCIVSKDCKSDTESQSMVLRTENLVKKYGKRTVVKPCVYRCEARGNCRPFRPEWRW